MKLIHFADLHIGMENYGRIDPDTGFSTRLLDFLNVLDFLISYALDNKVDAVLFAGDVYKNREPSQTHQREFAKRVLRLAKKKIPLVLLVGNHDTPNVESKANTLDIYSTLELEYVHVIRRPQLLEIPLLNSAGTETLQIIGIPWLIKKEYELLSDTLRSFYDKMNPSLPTVTMVHGTVEGSMYGSEKSLTLGKDPIIPLHLLTHPDVSYVALGHIHKRQILSENPPVLYSGSVERVDFGEEKEEKSFELIEIDSHKKATHTAVLTPSRRFVSIEHNLTKEVLDPTQDVLQVIQNQDLTDAVVKIILSISPDNLERLRPVEIKKAVEEKAYFLAGITKNIERSIRQRLEGVAAEELSPFEAMKKYFEFKHYPESKIAVLEKYANNLMENT